MLAHIPENGFKPFGAVCMSSRPGWYGQTCGKPAVCLLATTDDRLQLCCDACAEYETYSGRANARRPLSASMVPALRSDHHMITARLASGFDPVELAENVRLWANLDRDKAMRSMRAGSIDPGQFHSMRALIDRQELMALEWAQSVKGVAV